MIETTFTKSGKVVVAACAGLRELLKQADDNIAALQARREELKRLIEGMEISAAIVATGPGDGKLSLDDGESEKMPSVVRPVQASRPLAPKGYSAPNAPQPIGKNGKPMIWDEEAGLWSEDTLDEDMARVAAETAANRKAG